MGKDVPCTWEYKRAGVTILISDKITKIVFTEKE
jgi:hypothetical protein